MTLGRKIFNGIAILTLVVFILFSLLMVLGTWSIPEIRESQNEEFPERILEP